MGTKISELLHQLGILILSWQSENEKRQHLVPSAIVEHKSYFGAQKDCVAELALRKLLGPSFISRPLCKCSMVDFCLYESHVKASLGLFHAFWQQGIKIPA